MRTVIFLLCLNVGYVTSMITAWNDHCRQDPENGNQHLNKPEPITTNYNADPSCENGTLWWNYPRGGILVHFGQFGRQTFSVCVADALGSDYLTLVDETTSVHHTLPKFSRDDPDKKYCMHTHSGEIRLLMMASELQTYMAALDYYVQ